MVFQAPYNKIYKGSKTTYAAFCDRHKLPWAAFLYPYRMANVTTSQPLTSDTYKQLFIDLFFKDTTAEVNLSKHQHLAGNACSN